MRIINSTKRWPLVLTLIVGFGVVYSLIKNNVLIPKIAVITYPEQKCVSNIKNIAFSDECSPRMFRSMSYECSDGRGEAVSPGTGCYSYSEFLVKAQRQCGEVCTMPPNPTFSPRPSYNPFPTPVVTSVPIPTSAPPGVARKQKFFACYKACRLDKDLRMSRCVRECLR